MKLLLKILLSLFGKTERFENNYGLWTPVEGGLKTTYDWIYDECSQRGRKTIYDRRAPYKQIHNSHYLEQVLKGEIDQEFYKGEINPEDVNSATKEDLHYGSIWDNSKYFLGIRIKPEFYHVTVTKTGEILTFNLKKSLYV